MVEICSGPEALAWLRSNGHESALASNRFTSTAEAIAFVEELYSSGAKRVHVPSSSVIDDDEELNELGGPYTDTLIIEVDPKAVPEALESIYRDEATVEGIDLRFSPLPFVDERFLILWWD